MGIIRRVAKTISLNLFPIVGGYFAWMKKYAKHPEKYPHLERQDRTRKLCFKVCKDLNFDYHIEGLENIPDRASGIYCDHLSIADPLSFVALLEKPTSYISKKENEKTPFVCKVIQGLGGEFMDRDDLKQSLKVMMHVQKDLENNVKSWVIFPDGTRSKDCQKKVLPFHHGSFRPAFKAKAPIVPVAIYGTQVAMSGRHYYKKYPIYISILKPLLPEDYATMTTEEIANKVHGMIQRTITYVLRPKYHAEMCALGYKDYRFNQVK